MSDFLAMGGYAFYVWTSYGIAFIVLIANILLPHFRHKTIIKRLLRKARLQESHE